MSDRLTDVVLGKDPYKLSPEAQGILGRYERARKNLFNPDKPLVREALAETISLGFGLLKKQVEDLGIAGKMNSAEALDLRNKLEIWGMAKNVANGKIEKISLGGEDVARSAVPYALQEVTMALAGEAVVETREGSKTDLSMRERELKQKMAALQKRRHDIPSYPRGLKFHLPFFEAGYENVAIERAQVMGLLPWSDDRAAYIDKIRTQNMAEVSEKSTSSMTRISDVVSLVDSQAKNWASEALK